MVFCQKKKVVEEKVLPEKLLKVPSFFLLGFKSILISEDLFLHFTFWFSFLFFWGNCLKFFSVINFVFSCCKGPINYLCLTPCIDLLKGIIPKP